MQEEEAEVVEGVEEEEEVRENSEYSCLDALYQVEEVVGATMVVVEVVVMGCLCGQLFS